MELTKIEYRIMIAFYEQNNLLTKVSFLEKYPEFKINTVYMMIDRLVDKNYLEVLVDKNKSTQCSYKVKHSFSEFFSLLIGKSAVSNLVNRTIRESCDAEYLDFLSKLVQSSKKKIADD
ncbi:BlaI/MecI/CopY family transcriptional regulator [Enterococcus casseliflavus]|uniref:BlaI/MecI/CopY family transcriptional regulator n=1 Tax=Enterococcus casseliflavus TaxID=37734 RepID=UPI001BCEFCE0|nr:BlaI/MecI/CopY family transcriptional regulator [Enterococcus casseliflavus]